MLWNVTFLRKQTQEKFCELDIYLGVVLECAPVGEEKKVGATREGGLQYCQKGDLNQPHKKLWSWMACRVISNGITGLGCTPQNGAASGHILG